MSAIGSAIYIILTNDSDVSALIGARVYPMYVPQGAAMPAVTYQRIVAPRVHTLTNNDGMVPSTYQINCWADTMEGARELSEAVRPALNNYSGTVNGVVIQAVQISDEDDMPENIAGTDVLERFGKRLDFNIFYNE